MDDYVEVGRRASAVTPVYLRLHVLPRSFEDAARRSSVPFGLSRASAFKLAWALVRTALKPTMGRSRT